jgi:hypothetical protein
VFGECDALSPRQATVTEYRVVPGDLWCGVRFLPDHQNLKALMASAPPAETAVSNLSRTYLEMDRGIFHAFNLKLYQRILPVVYSFSDGQTHVSENVVWGDDKDDEPIRPMRLGSMRRHAVRGPFVTCQRCGHERAVNMDERPGDVTVRSFGPLHALRPLP